jgi:hypothetical protein
LYVWRFHSLRLVARKRSHVTSYAIWHTLWGPNPLARR